MGFEPVSGTKDWYNEEAITRNEIREKLRTIFERYGYNPIETPVIETQEALGFKGGGEIQKEVYTLTDRYGKKLALRFDQTVPLARFISSHGDIRFPFKRYAIGPVFRDGDVKPTQGRYKEFWQCDVDVLGIKEMAAEAELFALAQDAFDYLGLGRVDVRINNRKLLEGILDYAGVPDHAKLPTIGILDKIDKIGLNGVKDGLEFLTLSHEEQGLSNETFGRFISIVKERDYNAAIVGLRPEIISEVGITGYEEISQIFEESEDPEIAFRKIGDYRVKGNALLNQGNVKKLIEIVQRKEDNKETFVQLSNLVSSENGAKGLEEVKELLEMSEAMGFNFIRLDPSLARGLDYYTGTTIEVYLQDKKIIPSAILAGGRFDDMVGDFRGGDEIPAVGFSFGLERLAVIIGKQKEMQGKLKRTETQLYLIPIKTTNQCLKIAHQLRNNKLNVEMDLTGRRVGRNIEYAVALGIPYVGLVGDEELGKEIVTIRNLKSGEQKGILVNKVSDFIKSQLT